MLEYNLIDIWRLRNPDKRQFTWRKRNSIVQRRIDFWLISDDLQDDVKKAEIIPAVKTDHSGISLSVKSLKDQPFGPSYWKPSGGPQLHTANSFRVSKLDHRIF